MGATIKAGRLKPGDRFMKVDGHPVTVIGAPRRISGPRPIAVLVEYTPVSRRTGNRTVHRGDVTFQDPDEVTLL